MTPHGDKNPGTGRHRHYPYEAVGEAMLLKVLSNAVSGIQAIKSRAFRDLFLATKSEIEADRVQKKVLIVGLSSAGETTEIKLVPASEISAALSKSKSQAHLVIDLGKLF